MRAIASRILARLDDAINPIVVKELRQAVQSRFVTAMLITFLIIQVLVVGVSVVMSDDISHNYQGGRDIFMALLVMLLVACVVFVPIYAAVRLGAERNDANTDLFFITTIKPGAIIRGKLFSALVLTALIYGACMPFMTFTYLLRGLDMPSIALVLGIGLLASAVSIAVSIFAASIPVGRLLRVLFGLGLLVVLAFALAGAIGSTFQLLMFGVGTAIGSTDFWYVAGTTAAFSLLAIGLFYTLSVALISPRSANRTLPVRIYVTALCAIGAVIAWLWARYTGDDDPIIGWLSGVMLLLCPMFLLAISEREAPSRRVRRNIPRSLLLRPLAFIFYSGAAGGILWWVILTVATAVSYLVWVEIYSHSLTMSIHRSSAYRALECMAAVALYVYCYGLTAAALRRWFFKRVPHTYTFLIALGLVAIGSMLPIFVAYMAEAGGPMDRDFERMCWLGNPAAVFAYGDSYRNDCLIFTAVWAAIITPLSIPWLVRQARRFKPIEPEQKQQEAAPADA